MALYRVMVRACGKVGTRRVRWYIVQQVSEEAAKAQAVFEAGLEKWDEVMAERLEGAAFQYATFTD